MEINLYPPSQGESESFPPVEKGKTSDETGSEGHSTCSSSEVCKTSGMSLSICRLLLLSQFIKISIQNVPTEYIKLLKECTWIFSASNLLRAVQ